MGDLTLRQLAHTLSRYNPFLITIVAVILIATFMPGDDTQQAEEGPTAITEGSTGQGYSTGETRSAEEGGQAAAPTEQAGGPQVVEDSGERARGAESSSGTPAEAPAQDTAGTAVVTPAEEHPDCDPETGRIKIPSRIAPPCVPLVEGNPGNTYRGVTSDEILVAVPRGDANPVTQAMLTAAGVDDDEETIRQQHREWAEFYNTYYEQYGRTVRLEFFDTSGEGDEAARSDALHVAEEMEAFASFGTGGHGNPYVDDLAARGVLCFMCATSQSLETYHGWAPYAWSSLLSNTERYVHLAEYIGERLWGDEAVHAGAPEYQLSERKLAIVYYETEDEAYKAGTDFLEEELARYGAHLDDRIAYIADAARAQEQARTIMSRLKDQDITSVILATDPFYPVFFTQEATNQQYFPEWIVTGSALTDWNLFGRTYDQQQWQNAFGFSMEGGATVAPEIKEEFRLFEWHFDREPTAQSHVVIHAPHWLLFTGVHLAGPDLNPETFRNGMFSYPPSGGSTSGMVTVEQRSFGSHVWPWDTYVRNDDITEIWWDPSETGEDEAQNYGVGMYQYVDGGKRYMPGEWPSTEPRVFDPEGAVSMYEEMPPSDEYPEYESK